VPAQVLPQTLDQEPPAQVLGTEQTLPVTGSDRRIASIGAGLVLLGGLLLLATRLRRHAAT
jgi:LPXTG-motif cell wall-anchored protein